VVTGRSRSPHGLRREITAARLLGFRVRIPPAAPMSAPVIVVLCQVSVTGRPLVRRSPAELVFVSLRVISCNINHVHLQWAERCQTKEERTGNYNKLSTLISVQQYNTEPEVKINERPEKDNS
jgi:hypothetical protein